MPKKEQILGKQLAVEVLRKAQKDLHKSNQTLRSVREVMIAWEENKLGDIDALLEIGKLISHLR